jgi:hypothetical protein
MTQITARRAVIAYGGYEGVSPTAGGGYEGVSPTAGSVDKEDR